MKDIIKTFGSMTACVVGWMAGEWLWEEVLKEKMNNLKDKIRDRRK